MNMRLPTLKIESPSQAVAYQAVLDFSKAVKTAGGRSLLVGGCVRDMLIGESPKDFDLEVYNLDQDKIIDIASSFGKVLVIGKSFGVIKLLVENGLEIDIALPRKDVKIGVRHKDFRVEVDSKISLEDAARRRDFTINSLLADPITMEIFDPFGGVGDLEQRILRVTDLNTFGDDPLRVIRAMQFVGRFELTIEENSLKLMRKISKNLSNISKERLFEEWKKLFLKSVRPSLGLMAGMKIGIFDILHPEFLKLVKTHQDKIWHPEGNVWNHTMLSVDRAAEIVKREQLDDREAMVVLLALLCHDLGKPAVTEILNDRIISHGHEKAGEIPTRIFLKTIGVDNLTRDKVLKLVVNHLAPTILYKTEVEKHQLVSDKAIRNLAKRLYPATIKELILVGEADNCGRVGHEFDEYMAGEWLIDRAKKLEVEQLIPKSLITGSDLIKLGLTPSREFGQIIDLVDSLRDDLNLSKSDVLALIGDSTDKFEVINILRAALKQ